MPRYAIDTETDGFLKDLTKIHSMVVVDIDSGAVLDFADQPGHAPVKDGLDFLDANAELVAAHNAIPFDLPALRKVYGWRPRCAVRDTLIMSQFVFPDIRRADWQLRRNHPGILPPYLLGHHSLEAWGYRLKCNKLKYTGTWESWSPEMHTYMVQDGVLGAKLFRFLDNRCKSQEGLQMEHSFQKYLQAQEEYGVPFNYKEAELLYAKLAGLREEASQDIHGIYPPWFVNLGLVDKPPRRHWVRDEEQGGDRRWQGTKKGGYEERGYWVHVDGPHTTVRLTEFNPQSRHHIADRLAHFHGWKPEEYNKDGSAKVDDLVIGALPYPEAPKLARYLTIAKRIGILAEGKDALMKVAGKDGRIHGRVKGIGTITFRCTHFNPNMTLIPKVMTTKGPDGKKVILLGEAGGFGAEMRGLIGYDPDFWLVGGDASGLELRCLGHYLFRYDQGAFIKNLLEGDIHGANMALLGDLAPSRDCSKTQMYALLYGAGDKKLGKICMEYYNKLGLKPPRTDLMKLGKAVRVAIGRGLGIGTKDERGTLLYDINQRLENKSWLKGIDGRAVPVRAKFSALNTLLQSTGAIVVKYATVRVADKMSLSYEMGVDWSPAIHAHDELQLLAKEALAYGTGNLIVDSIRVAGEHLRLKCPLAGEYKIGRTWRDTH